MKHSPYFRNMMLFMSAIILQCALGSYYIYSQQALTIEPQKPGQSDSVTITFHADLGNKGLKDIQEELYMHTGVITNQSLTPSSWKYVKGVWAEKLPELALQSKGKNVYSFRFHPRTFYGIPDAETILRLAFVFRNGDGTKVGKDKNDGDFYLDFAASDSVKSSNEQLLLCLNAPTNEQERDQYCEGYYQDSFGMVINLHKGKLTIEQFGDAVFRISYDSLALPRINNPHAIVGKKSLDQFIVVDYGDYFQFRKMDASAIIQVDKYPVRLSFIKNNAIVAKESKGLFEQEPGKAVSFSLTDGEGIFGGGSRALPFNKRGHKFSLYNTAVYGYANGAEQLNIAIPFFVSTHNYGIFIDSHLPGAVDCAADKKNILTIALDHGRLSYFMVLGNSYAEIVSHFTELTGKQPLPPAWSLGYIQSKYGYKNQQETESMVEQLKKADMPLDGIVLDLFWFGDKEYMGNIDWAENQWPNPSSMIAKFNNIGVNTILITEPYFTLQSNHYNDALSKGLFAKNANNDAYVMSDFWAGKASLLDLTNPAAQSWMSSLYVKHMRLGISGWWSDLGEPEMHPKDMVHNTGKAEDIHNVYSMYWMSMLDSTQRAVQPEKRLFNLIRSGSAGMQRYATFPWSGDVQRSYSGLQAQIPIMLSMGLNGIGYMHSDLGGFTGGPKNDELYIRWLQFGSFTPIMRAHGEGVPSEPVLYADSVLSIVRFYAKLRMQLFPYNYSLAWQNSKYGYPLARPIFWNDLPAPEFINCNDEYLWGDNILVAPVLEPKATKRKILLPKGNWFDFWTNTLLPGFSNFEMPTPLSIMPIFVKGGAIIPFANPMNATKFYKGDSLTIVYFRDSSSLTNTFEMFNDNGLSPTSVKNGMYRVLALKAVEDTIKKTTRFSITTKEGNGFKEEPKQKVLLVKCINVQANPALLTLNNNSIQFAQDERAFYSSSMPIAFFKKGVQQNAPNEVLIRYVMDKDKAPELFMEHAQSSERKGKK